MKDDTFLQVGLYADYTSDKSDISPETIVFVEEKGNEKLIEQGKEFDFVPSGGNQGEVLTRDENGNLVWSNAVSGNTKQLTSLAGKVESNGFYFTAPIAITDLIANRSVTRKTAVSNGKIPNCIHIVLNVGDYTIQVACPLYEVILDANEVIAVTYEGTKINYDGNNYILSALCQREEDAIKASVSLTEPKS